MINTAAHAQHMTLQTSKCNLRSISEDNPPCCLTLEQAGPAHLKLGCGWVANADSCIAIILASQVPEVFLTGAQRPGEDFSEATHGTLHPQKLHKLIQRQLLAYCDCGRHAQTHIVVTICNGHILRLTSLACAWQKQPLEGQVDMVAVGKGCGASPTVCDTSLLKCRCTSTLLELWKLVQSLQPCMQLTAMASSNDPIIAQS